MKVLVITILGLTTLSSFTDALDTCVVQDCLISESCRCSFNGSPLPLNETPQLISLTFDEAVVENLYFDLWRPLLSDRKNPDGNPISGTFFVPHEYTDYSHVNAIYNSGFEIGVNSVTKNPLAQYWAHASEDILRQEFGDQRTIISKFASIPIEEIIGARAPQLQIEGDILVNAYIDAGIKYDNSWTTRSYRPLFPYTLDYLSTQECRTDTTCPQQPHPGFWILPIINVEGNDTVECNALTNCNYYGTETEIANWLFQEIQRVRSGLKAPLTLIIPSAWFRFIPNSYRGFEIFLNRIGTLRDTFLVSQKQILNWIKNPVPLAEFKTDTPRRTEECYSRTCSLINENNEIRYLTSCANCPEIYPWLGNPLGQLHV